MEEPRRNGRAVLGIILIFIGLALVAGYFHIFPGGLRSILISWQALLILIGLIFLLSRNKLPGIILIAIGVFFIIPELWSVPLGWGRLFWPAILILMGVLIMTRAVRRPRYHYESSSDYIDDMNIFGGGDHVISSQNFKGGRYTAIFGGSKYNMTSANMAKGRNYLDIFAMFGGVKFIIPSHWDVKIEVNSIFGGFSDKRTITQEEIRDPSKELVIKGIAIFGGGDVASY